MKPLRPLPRSLPRSLICVVPMVLAAAVGSLPAQGQAQAQAKPDAAAVNALAEQGRYWEGREQYGRAREAWQRVVDADPGNIEALSRLVGLATRENDSAGAKRYLDRLRTAAPGSAALKQAEGLVAGGNGPGRAGQGSPDPAALARARAAAASQDYPTALTAYREAFGGEPTGGSNAMEYYQTLGATEAGWAPAERWLRSNAANNPKDSAAALALAQHLTYREKTRREGIDKLAALSAHPMVGPQARKSQRQALIWLEGQPADAGRYRAWLATDDKDTEIRAKLDGLASAQRADAGAAYGARINGLFKQADSGDVAGAEAGFTSILKTSPGNADALGGMGVIRLRQQRYEESKSYLDKARAASPATAGRWREALTSANFWSRVQTAEKARLAGDYAAADSAYASALAAPPSEVPDSVRLAHADVLLNRGKDREAEAIARSALKRDDQNADALAVLLTVLSRSGRDAEALELSRKAPAKLRPQVATLRGEQLRRRAKQARDAGDLAGSERLLNDALLEQPANPWIRLDLSEVYRKQNRRAEAATLLDGLASSHGRNRDVRLAQAYFDAEQQDWAGVLNRLESFTAAERSADAVGLQRRAWVQYQLERARIALRRSRPGDAHRILTDTDIAAGGDPELLSALASGWAELQDPARAVAYMRRAMGDSRGATPALRAQYAALLLSAGQDAEFEVVAADLAARKDLDPAGQAALDQLVIGYRVKLADRARTEHRYPEAYLQLRDAVARYPANVQVQMALARLLTDARDIDAAASIYQSLAQREPDDIDIRLGLVDTLLAGDRKVAATREINRGLSLDAANPRWWRASGRLAEQENRKGAALKAYRRAEELERESPAEQPAPQLAWIDPRQPGVSLPAPVAELLAETSPDAPGPLAPRATGVAAAPAVQSAVGRGLAPAAPSAPAVQGAAIGLRPSNALTGDGVGPWQAAQVGQPLWLKLSEPAAPKGKPGTDAAEVYPIDPGPIARLESSTSGWVGGETAIRSRKGEGGLSQLFDLETPVTLNLPETSFGQASLTATPVYIDSGTASGTRLLRIGAGALVGGTETGTRDAGGVAFGLGYKLGDFRADIGVTPIGFEVERLVGGLSWRYSPDDLRLGVDVSRRAVSESLLAYSGAKDPLLGRSFGGVARTGGRVDVAYDTGRFGLYGYGGYYSYDGRNVETNASLLGGAGVFGRTALAANHGLTYGLNLTVFSFDDNRRFYTFGHGGYFSPQLFTAVTVPVQWAGVAGPLSWNLSAAFGVQSFREDGAPYYPGFDALQAELERVVALDPQSTQATGYAAQRSTGLGYTAKALSEYRIAPRLTVGGLFSIDNARNFRELQAHGYLRWYFSPQPPEATDPAPILPFYQY